MQPLTRLALIALLVPSAALAATPALWGDSFRGGGVGNGWHADAGPGATVTVADGMLRIRGPLNVHAHLERPLERDGVAVSALLRPGVPAGFTWGASVFVYWAPGVWCQLGIADHRDGAYYTAEAFYTGCPPLETQLEAADRAKFHWLRIEVGEDCIRYLARERDEGSWTQLRVVSRPSTCAGAPALLIVGKGYGRGEGTAYPAGDLDNDYEDAGPPCEALVDRVMVQPIPEERLRLREGESGWTGDTDGEAILAAKGDPTFDQVAAVYPPLALEQEAVGPKDHTDDIPVGPDGGLQLPGGKGRWLIGDDGAQFGVAPACSRSLEKGYLPIVKLAWPYGDSAIEQTIVGWSAGMSVSEPLSAYLRLSVSGAGGTRVPVRFLVGDGPSVEGAVSPGQPLCLRVPYNASASAPLMTVSEAEFAEVLLETATWWERELSRGMTLSVPEERLVNAYRAWLAWNYVDVDMVNGMPEPHDGSGFYEAVFGYSAARYAWALDLYGRHDDAARYLATLMAAQTPDGLLCWNFGLTDTGALLLAIAEHYRLTRDADWLRSIAPQAIKASKWIADHAEASRGENRDTVVEGLIEFRSYCDYPLPVFAYLHNCYCCVGMERVAWALREIGDTEAAETIESAAGPYRRDIKRSMAASAIALGGLRVLPLEPDTHRLLRDGGYTSGVYYGLIASMLLECGFLESEGAEAGGLVEFLRQAGGITMGTSQFPSGMVDPGIDHAYAYGYMLTQLERGERERYVLGLYAALAYGMTRDTYSGVEVTNHHTGANTMTLPHLYSGTQQLFMLRTLLIREEGDALILCDATPRAWLEDGKRIEVRDAPTAFGPVSYTVESHVARGEVRAVVDVPSERAPARLVLRLRHPDARPMASVRVNGASWAGHDAETIALPRDGGKLRILVRYR